MTTAVEVLAARLQNAHALTSAATVTGVPLHIAAALTEKESGGANVYGHDSGGTMWGVAPVTEANYAEFYRLVVEQGKRSNGVGPLQITYRGYFPQARDQGFRLWAPFDNIRFGLRIIAGSLRGDYSTASIQRAGTLYNAGNLNAGITTYGRDLATRAVSWRARLTDATLPRTLARGDDGADVATMQAGLMLRFPTYAGPIVDTGGADGSFGPGTEAVVKEFQTRVGLTPDGRVGPWTRGRLSEYGITP